MTGDPLRQRIAARSILEAGIAGVGFWVDGLPSWPDAKAYATGQTDQLAATSRPQPAFLPSNERRRIPDSAAVALEVAWAACVDAGIAPEALPSVFASAYGDLSSTDYLCSMLINEPRSISPTRFLNSVHNAAAGIWSIATGCNRATTAISAKRATFAEGLVESLIQISTGEAAVLLVSYDGRSTGPLGAVARSTGLLGAALVLVRDGGDTRLRASIADGAVPEPKSPLEQLAKENAASPMLQFFSGLANGCSSCLTYAGVGRLLRVSFERR